MREKNAAKMHFILTEKELAELTPTLEGLAVHSYELDAESAIVAGCEALTVIARLCGIYGRHGGTPITGDKDDDESFLSSIAYIYENFDKSFTVDELARMARMSRTAYIQRFKRVTGLPPKRFLTEYRISIAQKMLNEGEQTAAEIAHLVGCYDTSHLIKLLKRR